MLQKLFTVAFNKSFNKMYKLYIAKNSRFILHKWTKAQTLKKSRTIMMSKTSTIVKLTLVQFPSKCRFRVDVSCVYTHSSGRVILGSCRPSVTEDCVDICLNQCVIVRLVRL